MSSSTLNKREHAEVERSAAEASHIDVNALVIDKSQLARYLDPPADTVYPLEYSYHLLGDVRGKTVLEYGCGDGANTVMLALRGADVKALDISPDLIEVARRRLAANRVEGSVEFIVGSAHDLPLPDESVDVVFGMAILHHLDLSLSAREVRRVLRKGGRAIFQEPVRNSKFIKLVRGLIPYQSPDVSPFERPLTDEELLNYGRDFSSYRTKAFTFPTTNLVSLLPPLRKAEHAFFRWDAAVLQRLPKLSHYATIRVIEVVK
ncbi:MAG TPA: class I SAM-dependent methyltransferase [Pyrinomonadaceae bacterium]|jgi:SAM-dependent methyltransferase